MKKQETKTLSIRLWNRIQLIESLVMGALAVFVIFKGETLPESVITLLTVAVVVYIFFGKWLGDKREPLDEFASLALSKAIVAERKVLSLTLVAIVYATSLDAIDLPSVILTLVVIGIMISRLVQLILFERYDRQGF